MRLVLPFPQTWKSRKVPDGVLWINPERDLAVLVTAFHPAAPVAPTTATIDGWPIAMSAAAGPDASLTGQIHVFDMAATVVARCLDTSARPAWRDDVMCLLAAARIDLRRGAAVCVADQIGGAA